MRHANRKRKILWGRVAILAVALLLIVGGIFKIGSFIADCFEEKPHIEYMRSAPKYRYYIVVTVKEGDSIWSILEEQGYAPEEIPDKIREVESINTAHFGWRDYFDLTPGEEWLLPPIK